MDILQSLNWRYAIKRFDTNKKISNSDLEIIQEILRLTPSAYGLQPWKFLIIKNKELRKQLKDVSKNQVQVEESDFLIVFCYQRVIDERYVEKYIESVVKERWVPKESLEAYKGIILQSVCSLSQL